MNISTSKKQEQKIKASKCCYNCFYCNYVGGEEGNCIVNPEMPVDIYIFETCNLFKFLNKNLKNL